MSDYIKVEVLHELLRYEEDTGKLFWRERPRKFFSSDQYHTIWNKKNAGNEALKASNQGHLVGSILGKHYISHRVIWAMYYNKWPEKQIDHINGVRNDNRIENLRDVTPQENSRNQKLSTLNTSGHFGVNYEKRRNYWYSLIVVNHKSIYLGSFKNKEDAIAARKAAEIKYGFHENHGR